ncbi:MAG: hypothetical protein H7Y07_14135, partial [Pyrinomonadaceae bacterium]|nr:hypothetical protein [Sphingobacteriaceae bacterium]
MTNSKSKNTKRGILAGALLVSVFSFAFIDDLFQVSKNLDIFASVYKELNIN